MKVSNVIPVMFLIYAYLSLIIFTEYLNISAEVLDD